MVGSAAEDTFIFLPLLFGAIRYTPGQSRLSCQHSAKGAAPNYRFGNLAMINFGRTV
jgi:hypothetical protein